MKILRLRTRLHSAQQTAGWSLIEVVLAASLAGVVIIKSLTMMQLTSEVSNAQSDVLILEDQARLVMNRIGLALMGTDRDTLIPTIESIHTSGVEYKFSLGVESGAVVWSDIERISLEGAGDSVQWFENPGLPQERHVVWSNLVQPLLEGELPNGIDDNGNGLIDEEGLSFVLDNEAVVIRLTLRTTNPEGTPLLRTVESIVTCRN